jgi:hypothetical protein
VPSDLAELARPRLREPAFAAALAFLRAGPVTGSEQAFNEWHLRSAAATYARWGAVEQAHARLGPYRLPAARAYFSIPL